MAWMDAGMRGNPAGEKKEKGWKEIQLVERHRDAFNVNKETIAGGVNLFYSVSVIKKAELLKIIYLFSQHYEQGQGWNVASSGAV